MPQLCLGVSTNELQGLSLWQKLSHLLLGALALYARYESAMVDRKWIRVDTSSAKM